LVAVRRESGALVWRVPLGRLWALAVSEGAVYCAVADKLLALEPANGDLRWQAAGRGGPLAVLPDGVVQVVGRRLRRLRAADGALVWEQPVDQLAKGVPLVCGDRLVLATASAGPNDRRPVSSRLSALALADGRPLWQVELGPDGKRETASWAQRQPWLLPDGAVLLASRSEGGGAPATFARHDTATGRRLAGHAGDVRLNGPAWSGRSAALGERHVLLGTDDNDSTVCYDLATGNAAWREPREVDRGDYAQAIVAAVPGGFLFVRGRVLGVRDPATGAYLRRVTLPDRVTDAIVDGATVFALTADGALVKIVL
jgi:outer membrane protein assembly factor BamB